MITNNYNKGFTLIELLVVIAIIGILSSVVLSALNSARIKGANSAVKNNLANARSQSEFFYDANANSYAGLCAVSPPVGVSAKTIYDMVYAANVASGAGGNSGNPVITSATVQPSASPLSSATTNCRANAGSWAVSAPLRSPEVVGGVTRNFWCVDYTGTSAARRDVLSTSNPFTCPST